MKRLFLAIMVAMSSGIATFSQSLSEGFFRVQNVGSGHYIYVRDCTGDAGESTLGNDMDAIELWDGLDNTLGDPGSVMYFSKVGDKWDITSQNTGVHALTGYYMTIQEYSSYCLVYSDGHYLYDIGNDEFDPERSYVGAKTASDMPGKADYRKWKTLKIDSSTDNFFGFRPTVKSNGKYYAPFFAAFAYTPVNSNVRTWYINKVDKKNAVVVMSEVSGTVAKSQPVFVECAGSKPSSNKVKLTTSAGTSATSNLLKGAYFCNGDRSFVKAHPNDPAVIPFDAATMRVLTTDKSGNLVFSTSSQDLVSQTYKQGGKSVTALCIPHNTSYLTVDSDCPETLMVLTQEEYDEKYKEVIATGISLNKTTLSVQIGGTVTLKATVTPSNTTDKSVTWSSDNASVAEVSQSGVVTAKALGSATITAMTADGSKLKATCSVTVNPILATGISLDRESLSLQPEGTARLTATVTPGTTTDKTVKWSTSDAAVATVDQTGLVTAKSVGNATITAETTDGSKLSKSCVVTVNPILATGISLNKTTLSLQPEATAALKATVSPANVTNSNVKWSSSNSNVADVDQTGQVTALSVGSATITAMTADGTNLTATCTVTVNPILATGISLDRKSVSLDPAETVTLYATVTPANVTDNGVKWTTSDASVAEVDQTGLVTARNVGTATITATTVDGTALSESCKVTVKPVLAKAVSLDVTELYLNPGGKSMLTATVTPDNTTDKSVAWTSDNTSVATVDGNGQVTAKVVGTATITATTKDGTLLSAACKVTVTSAIVLATGISLDKDAVALDPEGSVQLVATLSPSDVTDNSVSWTSSDETVATVSGTGLVNALKPGKAVVQARTNDGTNLKATCSVTVNPILAASITLDEEEVEMYVDDEYTLTATVYPENATDKSVEWLSSDTDVATVVDGVVVPKAEGTVTVTAKTTDGSNLSASCQVTVRRYSQYITWDQEFPEMIVGSPCVRIEASASSGLDLAFTTDNENVVCLFLLSDGVYINPVAAGTVEITASQAGDDYYSAAEDVTKTLTVVPITGISSIEADGDAASIHTVSGVRVNSMRRNQLYIVGGRKVVIK